MFHVAFLRGQGPVFADLPPTLQPFAVAASAPPSDHVRAVALSGLVYLLLGAAALAFASFAPSPPLVMSPPTRSERIVEFDGPPRARPIERASTASGGPGGQVATVASAPAVEPRADPEAAAAALPIENHRGDVPGAGSAQSGPMAPATGPALSLGVSGPAIRDYSMVGLTVLRQVDPVYPEFARRARIQGPVVLMMTVDDRGQPIEVHVLEGHPAFHEAALSAARQWRFEPAQMDGQPVSATFRLTLKFSLR